MIDLLRMSNGQFTVYGAPTNQDHISEHQDSSLSSYLDAIDRDVLRSSKQVSVLNEQGPLPSVIMEEMINTDSIAVPPDAP